MISDLPGIGVGGSNGSMSTVHERWAAAGLRLPAPPAPGGRYEPFVWSGRQLLVAGQICRIGEQVRFEGVVGADLTVEAAQEAARLCALNTLSVVGAACNGDFDGVRLLSLSGFVRCTPGFGGQAHVMDGASEVFLEALGERGRHMRTAVGVHALPRGVPVEISTVFEVADHAG